jgi:DNA-binding MarR family transcriptional regulator
MGKFELLNKIIPYIDEFEKLNQKADVNDFNVWLNKKLNGSTSQNETNSKGGVLPEIMENLPDLSKDIVISNQLRYLFKYSNLYTKKALEGTNLKTINDIAFLGTLLVEKDMSKSELINKHVTEITSGTEVIKRLNKFGLLEDYKNEKDGRSKKVQLTEEGKELIVEILHEVDKVSRILTAGLSDNEKEQLLIMLVKLRKFHDNLYQRFRKKSIEDIFEEVIK